MGWIDVLRDTVEKLMQAGVKEQEIEQAITTAADKATVTKGMRYLPPIDEMDGSSWNGSKESRNKHKGCSGCDVLCGGGSQGSTAQTIEQLAKDAPPAYEKKERREKWQSRQQSPS